MPAAAHVREQADARFRHGEPGVLGRDAELAGQRYAHAAAHGDAVHESHDGLFVSEHLVIELILVVEEFAARHAAIVQRRVAQEGDIAAGAKAAPFRMVEDHRFDRVVVSPFGERPAHRVDHLQRQRVQRLGPVQGNMADAAVAVNVKLVGHTLQPCRNRSRPTIMRITWFVPSRIECTRRSRQKRSMG